METRAKHKQKIFFPNLWSSYSGFAKQEGLAFELFSVLSFENLNSSRVDHLTPSC